MPRQVNNSQAYFQKTIWLKHITSTLPSLCLLSQKLRRFKERNLFLKDFPQELYPSQQKSSRLGQSAPVSVPHLPTRVTKLLQSHWWFHCRNTEGVGQQKKGKEAPFKPRTKRLQFFENGRNASKNLAKMDQVITRSFLLFKNKIRKTWTCPLQQKIFFLFNHNLLAVFLIGFLLLVADSIQ